MEKTFPFVAHLWLMLFFVEVSWHFFLLAALSHTVTSPRTWSVDEVAKLVEKTDLKDYVNLFRENVSVSFSFVPYAFSL